MAKRKKTEFGWVREEAKTYEPGQHEYRPLNEREEKQRQLMMTAALDMAKRVDLVNDQTAYLTPDQLDLAWERVAPTPENDIEVLFAAYLFGFPLGEYLVTTNGMQWCVFTDEEGSSLAVHHPLADVTAFPIASVQKRVVPRDPPFFKAVASTVIRQISSSLAARKELEDELAKEAAERERTGRSDRQP